MTHERGNERGSATLYAISAAFVAAALCMTLLRHGLASKATAAVEAERLRSQYLAEGSVEAAKRELRVRIARGEAPPADGAARIETVDVPYTIAPTGFETVTTDDVGIRTLSAHYRVEGTGQHQQTSYRAKRIVSVDAIPLFQFMIFYTNDLEILPGPNMTIRGRVHTNGDLYLGSNATVTFDTNYLRAAGEMYRHRKDNPLLSQGTVNIRAWVENPFSAFEPSVYFPMRSQSQLLALGVPSPSGFDSNFDGFDLNGNGEFTDPGDWLPWVPGALDLWDPPAGYTNGTGHTVLSGEHGVGEIVLPGSASTAMFEPAPAGVGGDYDFDPATQTYVPVADGTGEFVQGYYHGEAGLSILVQPNGTWTAYDGDGVNVTSSLGGVVTMEQMYDARQASGSPQLIWVAEIDMAALNASGQFPDNGLLYAAWYGEGTGLDADGIRLANAETLQGPLTVVTEDPIYLLGDYNTEAKKPAAVIADAVNLLSNDWNDSKVLGTLPLASAGGTTYNVAMVSGNHDTEVGGYNGGFENLPRFHENWSGRVCAITGSFVNAWLSQFATGAWVYGGDRYTAPIRQWQYDTAFNDVANLPPYTPMAVSARDVVSW